MVLKDFIMENKAFALKASAADWKQAVKIGTDLLAAAYAAEPRYYDSILEMTEQNGPYYVITPGIAMPHARPEMGALSTGFSLVTLKEPVVFGHSTNDPVDIVLCICAKNADDLNEEVIIDAVTLFDDEKAIAALRKAETEEELIRILDSIVEED